MTMKTVTHAHTGAPSAINSGQGGTKGHFKTRSGRWVGLAAMAVIALAMLVAAPAKTFAATAEKTQATANIDAGAKVKAIGEQGTGLIEVPQIQIQDKAKVDAALTGSLALLLSNGGQTLNVSPLGLATSSATTTASLLGTNLNDYQVLLIATDKGVLRTGYLDLKTALTKVIAGERLLTGQGELQLLRLEGGNLVNLGTLKVVQQVDLNPSVAANGIDSGGLQSTAGNLNAGLTLGARECGVLLIRGSTEKAAAIPTTTTQVADLIGRATTTILRN